MEKPKENPNTKLNWSKTVKHAALLCLIGSVMGVIAAPFTAADTPWIAKERVLTFAPEAPDSEADRASGTPAKRSVSTRPTEPLAISLEQAWTLFYDKTALFLDARTARDYQKGHIVGSKNLPYSELELYMGLLDDVAKDSTIVTYCSGADCELSVHLADELASMGYTNLRVFFGGWPQWVGAGYPETKGATP